MLWAGFSTEGQANAKTGGNSLLFSQFPPPPIGFQMGSDLSCFKGKERNFEKDAWPERGVEVNGGRAQLHPVQTSQFYAKSAPAL